MIIKQVFDFSKNLERWSEKWKMKWEKWSENRRWIKWSEAREGEVRGSETSEVKGRPVKWGTAAILQVAAIDDPFTSPCVSVDSLPSYEILSMYFTLDTSLQTVCRRVKWALHHLGTRREVHLTFIRRDTLTVRNEYNGWIDSVYTFLK